MHIVRGAQLPTERLAMAIALEFDVQDVFILPYTMPLTTLATTAIDQISKPQIRQYALEGMMRQLRHDLLCLRRYHSACALQFIVHVRGVCDA